MPTLRSRPSDASPGARDRALRVKCLESAPDYPASPVGASSRHRRDAASSTRLGGGRRDRRGNGARPAFASSNETATAVRTGSGANAATRRRSSRSTTSQAATCSSFPMTNWQRSAVSTTPRGVEGRSRTPRNLRTTRHFFARKTEQRKRESQKMTKACRHCGQRLPVAEFPERRGASDGLSSWCRHCHRENVRAVRRHQHERARAERQKVIEEGNVRLREQTRTWRERIARSP